MPSLPDYHLLTASLITSVLLFAIGAVGLMARRSSLQTAISLGVMFQAVMLMANAFGSFHGTWVGQILSLFVFVIAAGIAIMLIGLQAVKKRASNEVADE